MLSQLFVTICLICLTACTFIPASNPSPQPPTLTITGWAGYMPPALLDAFKNETGIEVTYIGYDNTEEAISQLQQGAQYDLLIVSYQFIPELIHNGTLAPINRANIPNIRNLSATFRDLAFDPGERYSVIYQWGITGLLVRTDLLARPIKRWSDLWNPTLDGKILLWPIPRDTINVLLKSLGYSINTTDTDQLATALARAPALAQRVGWVDSGVATATQYLVSGEYAVALAWAYDARDAQQQDERITFIIPEDGTVIWLDSFVIPTTSTHPELAEQFINFFLRPDMSALVTNELVIATANEASWPLVKPELLANTSIFPSNDILERAELEVPLDPATQKLHHEIWRVFTLTRS
ncbi:ABC transporter substrate-binding protein [Chloroflexus aggregans]|nr:spermidine/putrescine ABC transporter substrate-binding protein [Chloroflexus aggregans]